MSVLSLALNHPPIQRVRGHEPDQSSLFSVNFKNEWSYASSPICLHGRHGDNFNILRLHDDWNAAVILCQLNREYKLDKGFRSLSLQL